MDTFSTLIPVFCTFKPISEALEQQSRLVSQSPSISQGKNMGPSVVLDYLNPCLMCCLQELACVCTLTCRLLQSTQDREIEMKMSNLLLYGQNFMREKNVHIFPRINSNSFSRLHVLPRQESVRQCRYEKKWSGRQHPSHLS